jgi:hypothetical protein
MPDPIVVPKSDSITITSEEFLKRSDLLGEYARVTILDEEGKPKAHLSAPRDVLMFDGMSVEALEKMGLLSITDDGSHWVVRGATTVRVWKESQEDDRETILNRAFETVCRDPKEIPLDWDQKRHLSRWVYLVKKATGEEPELGFFVKKALDQVQITVVDKKSGHELDLTRGK